MSFGQHILNFIAQVAFTANFEFRYFVRERVQNTMAHLAETGCYILSGRGYRYVQFISKRDRKHCRMLTGLVTRHTNLQSAQDEKSKDSLVQEMRCNKGNIGTNSMQMPGIEKGKDADLGLYQDGSGTDKIGEAERNSGPQ